MYLHLFVKGAFDLCMQFVPFACRVAGVERTFDGGCENAMKKDRFLLVTFFFRTNDMYCNN